MGGTLQAQKRPAPDSRRRPVLSPFQHRRAAATLDRASRRHERRGAAPVPGLSHAALLAGVPGAAAAGAAGHHQVVASHGAERRRHRRAGELRQLLHPKLVGMARPVHPEQDDRRGRQRPRGVLMAARGTTLDSPVVAWALLAIGIVACASAWRDRQPDTTADFTILYASARHTSVKMFDPPPGHRRNMNPPLVQLMLRPLTAFPL